MRFTVAIGVSIAFHGVLAVGLVAYLKFAPGPTTLATLDLSSVELSFAEEDTEAAVVAPSLPAPPPEPPMPPKELPPESNMEVLDNPLPPDAETVKIPEPEIERKRMEMPEMPKEEQEKEPEKSVPMSEPTPAVAPKQAKVDAPPRPKKAIRPEYPTGARQRGEQGDVVVEIRVNERGTVDYVTVVESCGFHELDESAIRAAKKARFTPAKTGSRSIASTARLTLTFRLR